MRARNIKPGFFQNEALPLLDKATRLLFIGLWMLADREGKLEDRPMKIRGMIFPYENIDCDKCLNDLQKAEFILRYETDNKQYIQVINFSEHQNPHTREKESVIPSPNNAQPRQVKAVPSPADSLIPDSLIPDKKKGRFAPPSINDITSYCQQRNNKVTPTEFFDHYETNGWMRGKTKIKSWKACIRTWENNRANGKRPIGSRRNERLNREFAQTDDQGAGEYQRNVPKLVHSKETG